MIGFLNITVVEQFAIASVSAALCPPHALLAAQTVPMAHHVQLVLGSGCVFRARPGCQQEELAQT